MRSIRQVGNLVKIIVEHPNGGLLSLPASETSLELTKPCPVVKGQTPLFDPLKLLRLAEWVGTLDPAAIEKISLGQQHEQVVQRKIDDTTAQNTQSRSKRTGRPHPAVNQSDGAAGGQNAIPRTTGTETRGETN